MTGAVVREHPETRQPSGVHQHHGRVVQSAEFDCSGGAQAPRIPPVQDEFDKSLQRYKG
jgi:hypothetical protein